MPLYERLMGIHATRPKIPTHQFQAAACEWAQGNLTGAAAQDIISMLSRDDDGNGVPLDATEQAEAQALVDTVTSIPITGSAAAQADGRARRALRLGQIDRILLLADSLVPGYETEAAVKAKLGV